MICHGCQGKGWVDSQYKGAMRCPICGGTGKLDTTIPKASIIPPPPPKSTLANKNPLLLQLEVWLRQQSAAVFGHPNKTMNTYNFVSKTKSRMMGLVWVSTNGADRIYLFKADYTPADPNNAVKYQNVWGGYPQFAVQTQADVEHAKNLISHALVNL